MGFNVVVKVVFNVDLAFAPKSSCRGLMTRSLTRWYCCSFFHRSLFLKGICSFGGRFDHGV